jgi:hypothetical protein
MHQYDPRSRGHWRTFNRMIRVVGAGFLLWGIGFAAWGIHLVRNLDLPFWENGIETHEPEPRLLMAAMAGIMAVFGLLMLLMRSYRPDLGDVSSLDRFVDPFGTRGPRPAGRRSWWTGDPLD